MLTSGCFDPCPAFACPCCRPAYPGQCRRQQEMDAFYETNQKKTELSNGNMHLSFLPLPLLVPWRYPSPAPSHSPFSSKTDPQYQNHYQQPLGFDDSKHSKSTNNPLDERFERRVEWMLDHFQLPGLSIAVVTGNDTFLRVSLNLTTFVILYSSSALMLMLLSYTM
jgi:hypothetical protein